MFRGLQGLQFPIISTTINHRIPQTTTTISHSKHINHGLHHPSPPPNPPFPADPGGGKPRDQLGVKEPRILLSDGFNIGPQTIATLA